jgi:hypothetical protein
MQLIFTRSLHILCLIKRELVILSNLVYATPTARHISMQIGVE